MVKDEGQGTGGWGGGGKAVLRWCLALDRKRERKDGSLRGVTVTEGVKRALEGEPDPSVTRFIVPDLLSSLVKKASSSSSPLSRSLSFFLSWERRAGTTKKQRTPVDERGRRSATRKGSRRAGARGSRRSRVGCGGCWLCVRDKAASAIPEDDQAVVAATSRRERPFIPSFVSKVCLFPLRLGIGTRGQSRCRDVAFDAYVASVCFLACLLAACAELERVGMEWNATVFFCAFYPSGAIASSGDQGEHRSTSHRTILTTRDAEKSRERKARETR